MTALDYGFLTPGLDLDSTWISQGGWILLGIRNPASQFQIWILNSGIQNPNG